MTEGNQNPNPTPGPGVSDDLWKISDNRIDADDEKIQQLIGDGILVPFLPKGSAAIEALRADVWQEHKKGLRPFDGIQANQSWLTINVEGDVIGWDINRAARIAVDAAVGEEEQ